MIRRATIPAALGCTLFLALAWLFAAPARGPRPQGKEVKHHILLGTITHINAAAGTFEIRTGRHKTALCYLNAKSVIRRGGREIRLSDVREGERVRCKCSQHAGNRHYSLELLVKPEKKSSH